MGVEHGGTVLGCRLEVEVEIGGEERWVDAEPSGVEAGPPSMRVVARVIVSGNERLA